MKSQKKFNTSLIFLGVVISILVVFIIQLMRHVQNLLELDTKINLTEIVSQNKESITNRLTLNIQSVEVLASQLSDEIKYKQLLDKNLDIQEAINEFGTKTNSNNVFIANAAGTVFRKNRQPIYITGRKYFRTSMTGRSNISDQIISRLDGEDIFIISAPIMIKNNPVGSVQKILTKSEMYQMASLPLFSSNGYIYIVDEKGYVVIHTSHNNCQKKSDNYFRDLHASGNPEQAEKIRSDITAKKSGLIETTVSGVKIFSSYTPIDKARGWYLVVSVPVLTVSPNANIVIHLFYAILFFVTLISAISMVYFLIYKNRQQMQLEKIAFVDPVTDGNTYSKFLINAENSIKEPDNKTRSIIKVDIDNFKYINKFHGFDFGNTVLKYTYQKFANQLRQHEHIARISDDNYALLLEDISPERLSNLFDPTSHKDASIYFSAGIYQVNDPQENINTMLDKAAIAAKKVKGLINKHYAFYTEQMEAASIHNEKLKSSIKTAFAADEFVAFYQPKVDISSNKITGCEALARWKKPDGKFISPGEFIPLCEQTGMIIELDMIIYEKSLKFLRNNLENNIPCVPVSINFSKLHLASEDFFQKIKEKLNKYEIPPKLIEIELTESALFSDFDIMCRFARQLQEHGFLVAMDDFGSGYSSLNMLKNMPIDILKIDKEFLSSSADNTKRDIIFTGIAKMANSLGLSIVVEGVETADDVELMQKSGCHIAQGYYFSRPIPEDAFSSALRNGTIKPS
ncbi:bifunctional diguanylate cyclase/phosphodiesterase [Laribacter hongkongensis]|uniref:bifunctional diguanylate cyclase/phosphodiesterase n=1 Tax=Laribacter hongkongensis TaxID=168471 RepID=UPI001EFDD22F|nr:GGDEF domain-containing protein [Laribacter hongkongensis]MCG9084263.1 GGDEF domain-containing protein [Laribacter hongkongensis]